MAEFAGLFAETVGLDTLVYRIWPRQATELDLLEDPTSEGNEPTFQEFLGNVCNYGSHTHSTGL